MTSQYATHEESQAVMGQPASQAQMLVERMIEARKLDEQGISPGKYAQGLYQIAVELAEQQDAELSPAAVEAALAAWFDSSGNFDARMRRAYDAAHASNGGKA